MVRRLVSFAALALVLALAVSTGWAQAPSQPKQPEQPTPAPGMPGMMMPMMQLCTQMMNQMASMMGAQQTPPATPSR